MDFPGLDGRVDYESDIQDAGNDYLNGAATPKSIIDEYERVEGCEDQEGQEGGNCPRSWDLDCIGSEEG